MRLRFIVVSFFVFALSIAIGAVGHWATQDLEPGTPTEPKSLIFMNDKGEPVEVNNIYGLAVRSEEMKKIEYWLAQKAWLGYMPTTVNTSERFATQEIDEKATIARNNAWFAAHAIVGLPEPTKEWSIKNMVVKNMNCSIKEDDFIGIKNDDPKNILNITLRPTLFSGHNPSWTPTVKDVWDKGYVLHKTSCDFTIRSALNIVPINISEVSPGVAGKWFPVYSAENEPPIAENIPNWKGGSLGLVYGLAYIDYLTPEPLVPENLVVAGTGAIGVSPTGWSKIFEVRSVEEKTLSASWINADIIFVPEGQKNEADPKMKNKVIEVGSLEEAVGWLCSLGSPNRVCERFSAPRTDAQLLEEFFSTNALILEETNQ